MLTPDELAAIPLFSTSSPLALAEVARVAADIHLNTGEFAVHQGERRPFSSCSKERSKVIKLVDGVERKLGLRSRGKMFGEIPLVFGTQFQAGFRAGEPSRVLKVDAQPYYAIAASSPELAKTMEEAGPRSHWRPAEAGGRAAQCASRHGRQEMGQRLPRPAPFSENVSDLLQLAGARGSRSRPTLAGAPPADGDCPVLRLADGAILVRPQPREFAARLGLQHAPVRRRGRVPIGGVSKPLAKRASMAP